MCVWICLLGYARGGGSRGGDEGLIILCAELAGHRDGRKNDAWRLHARSPPPPLPPPALCAARQRQCSTREVDLSLAPPPHTRRHGCSTHHPPCGRQQPKYRSCGPWAEHSRRTPASDPHRLEQATAPGAPGARCIDGAGGCGEQDPRRLDVVRPPPPPCGWGLAQAAPPLQQVVGVQCSPPTWVEGSNTPLPIPRQW